MGYRININGVRINHLRFEDDIRPMHAPSNVRTIRKRKSKCRTNSKITENQTNGKPYKTKGISIQRNHEEYEITLEREKERITHMCPTVYNLRVSNLMKKNFKKLEVCQ